MRRGAAGDLVTDLIGLTMAVAGALWKMSRRQSWAATAEG
jgi:hypothetical protein